MCPFEQCVWNVSECVRMSSAYRMCPNAVSVLMTGNYPRQPVNDDGPLSLKCWSQISLLLVVLYSLTSKGFRDALLHFHGYFQSNKMHSGLDD